MKACLLHAPAPMETNPLQLRDVPTPEPTKGEVLVRVRVCGVCRTDLHVIEGELSPRKSPVIPGIKLSAWSKGSVRTLGGLPLARGWALPGCTIPTACASTA